MASDASHPTDGVDPEPVAALLRGSRRVLLTGHERPDGDCIGAQAALAHVLTAMGQDPIVLNPDAPERRYAEVLAHGPFEVPVS